MLKDRVAGSTYEEADFLLVQPRQFEYLSYIMSKLMKMLSALVITSLFLTIVYAQPDPKDYSEALHLISIWLDAQKDYEQLPGISAAIGHDQGH